MPTYRVYLKRIASRLPPYQWEWMETVSMVNDENTAIYSAYQDWKSSDPSVPPLNQCQSQVNMKGEAITSYCAQINLYDSIVSAGQKAFSAIIQKNINDFFGTQLDGDFEIINYPSGFNYGITYGSNAYYNQATLQDIDTMVCESSNGLLELTGERFSNYYKQILESVVFSFSNADKITMQTEQSKASAQIASVKKEFEDAGGIYSNPLPFGGEIQDIINQMITTYKSIENIPDTLNGLRDAIAQYKQNCKNSYVLNQRYYAATARVEAAINNTKTPTPENGGMQVDKSKYYVSFTPNKLLTANQLMTSLNNDNSKISIDINLYNFQSNSMEMKLSGSTNSINIPIAGILNFKLKGSASYDLSKYVESSTNVTISITYPGITLFHSTPSELSPDNSIDWYSSDILKEVVNKTGKDETGYKLQGSEYNLNETFGKGKNFSRVKTFVICQQPTIILTFEGGNANEVVSDFQAKASIGLNVLGFDIGSSEGTYSVTDVKNDAHSNNVTVTLGPAKAISGTTPLEQQVAYVLGGVASYPPNNI